MPINFSKFIENRISNIQSSDSFAFAAAIGLGPWIVPLGPAIIFGYAMFVSAPAGMAEFRIVTAVAVAVALIVAGAVSSHNAIKSEAPRAWGLVIGYISLEIIGLWLMSVTFDVKVVGTVASLLTLIVYLSRSMAKEINNNKAEAIAAEQVKIDFQVEQARLNANHQRRMAERRAELSHAEKLARIEAKAKLAGKLPETNSDFPEADGKLPEWLPALPESLSHFREMVGNGSARLPDDMTGAELGRLIGKSARTGQNWLAGVRNGNGVRQ
jgi:hypothetical protein